MQTLTMKLKRPLARAALAGAACIATAGLLTGQPVHADEKKPTVSKDLAKPLKAAQDLIQQKKYADGLAKLKEAEGNPKKTPYDQHVINQLAGFAYAKTSNYPEASKAFEAQLSDGFTPADDAEHLVVSIAQMQYSLKNYDKAIEFGNRALKSGADENMQIIVGQSYYLKGDWKGLIKFEDPIVESQIKAGKTPKDEPLKLLLSSCLKLEDQGCITKQLERLVAYYPQTEYWQQLLYTLYTAQGQTDKQTLQLFRLMSEVDVLKRPEDYTEMAQLAIEQGSPGEAQHILEKAFQKNVFTDPRMKDKNTRLLESAKKAAAADLASLPKVEKDADAATTGDKNIGVGLAYLGYQQYDKAADHLNKGLTKGGVKSEPEARLLLGIAQLKGGHKEDAIKTFKAVKGDSNLERLADLWSLRAKQA